MSSKNLSEERFQFGLGIILGLTTMVALLSLAFGDSTIQKQNNITPQLIVRQSVLV